MTNAFKKRNRLSLSVMAVLTVASLLTSCSNGENKDAAAGSDTTDYGQGQNPQASASRPINRTIFSEKDMDEGDIYAKSFLDPRHKKEPPGPLVKEQDGLEYQDMEPGFGMSPSMNRMVMVHYTGSLSDGTKFDSSRDRGMPFTFIVGSGKVIKGFEQGIMGMKVGGRRRIIIPPSLGYGAEGHGNKVPPNATLVYDVSLLSCDR